MTGVAVRATAQRSLNEVQVGDHRFRPNPAGGTATPRIEKHWTGRRARGHP
jgi:hypothetical protein